MKSLSQQNCCTAASGAFFILTILLLSNFRVAAQAQDYTYTTKNGAITITGYTGRGGDVTIPDTIDSLSVNDIGNNAFWFCSSLPEVLPRHEDGKFTE